MPFSLYYSSGWFSTISLELLSVQNILPGSILVIKISLAWQAQWRISLLRPFYVLFHSLFFLSRSLFLITPFPLSSFPLLPTFDLLHSSPVFSVLKSCLNFCLCFSILCVLPSPLLCLPEAGEDDVWVQLVGCPGRAAGVVPAGHLLLWSWRTQPAAAEHGESTDAGGSSSNQPHQKALCFVSLAQHCGWFNIEICHMTFHRWWMILYFYTFSTRLFIFIFELIYWLHWPVFQL